MIATKLYIVDVSGYVQNLIYTYSEDIVVNNTFENVLSFFTKLYKAKITMNIKITWVISSIGWSLKVKGESVIPTSNKEVSEAIKKI